MEDNLVVVIDEKVNPVTRDVAQLIAIGVIGDRLAAAQFLVTGEFKSEVEERFKNQNVEVMIVQDLKMITLIATIVVRLIVCGTTG